VAQYADACNIIGDAAMVKHKVEVLHGHCAEVGRDPGRIEVTALMTIADDAPPDTILREAETFSAAGVDAIVIRSTGPDPVRWLQETWAPVVPRLEAIG
jgi:hypothetical protein